MHIIPDNVIVLIWITQIMRKGNEYFSRIGVRQIINANRYIGKLVVHYSLHRRCWTNCDLWESEMREMVRLLIAGGVMCVCVDPLWDRLFKAGMKETYFKWRNDALVATTLSEHI